MEGSGREKISRPVDFYCHFLLEEAVNKVKIQAMSEVQKAVAEAEQKAFEVIATERARMEQTIADVKRQAAEDAFLVINEQEESTEVRVLLPLEAGELGKRGGAGVTRAEAAAVTEPTVSLSARQ